MRLLSDCVTPCARVAGLRPRSAAICPTRSCQRIVWRCVRQVVDVMVSVLGIIRSHASRACAAVSWPTDGEHANFGRMPDSVASWKA